MSDLKPCPFCGGPATHIKLNHVIGCVPCAIWVSEDRKDVWQRRTQPEATKPAQDLSAAILALPLPKPFDSGDGNHEDKFTESQFREFRAAAAALASPADALVAGDRVDAERWRFRQKFLLDGGAVLWSQRGCQYRNAQGAIICQGGTEEEAIDAAIQAQKDGHG